MNWKFFLNSLNSKFDIIGLSETRLLSSLNYGNPSLPGYQSFTTPTEAFHGGTALFISNHINCCRRSDLESLMYSPKNSRINFYRNSPFK